MSSLSNGHAVSCFPTSLVASVAEALDDGTRFEIGLIGSEGLLGWPSVLSFAPEPQTAIVQLGGGSALAIPTEALIDACSASETLHIAMLRFAHAFSVQMSLTIVANLRDGIEQRLARWLLMLHDRIDGDAMAITHGELAGALHVRRASITDALHVLEGERMLRCTRGQITVRDRAALTEIAGACYGPAETRYRMLIGDFGKS
ncbi:Crp/Fnr family transcriptional regulator [Sphingomonas floccifaciens]|uniref:Crp/Fnr family transcriptional regulator n=1 Tax=Sphingomonas floccifaciens TaxID=1844115 RepID=A0ABW4NF95_9SPHN